MTFPKLPDAELARKQSSFVRAERERERLEADERARQEKREKRKQLQLERKRNLEINKERNHWIRSAIQRAANGKFFFAIGEVDEEVRLALEHQGFYIENQQNLLNALETTDLYEFWCEHSLPVPDCSHGLPLLEQILRSSIDEGFGYDHGIDSQKIDRIIRTLLIEYYNDALEERFDRLINKFRILSELRYREEPIHHSELIFDNDKRKSFKRSRNGRLLNDAPLNLYVFSLREAALKMIAEKDEFLDRYRKLANYISIEVRKDLLQYRAGQVMMSWYQFPYVAKMGTRRFSEVLLWLASQEGQLTSQKISRAIAVAIQKGLIEVEVPLGTEIHDIKLASIFKHFLRGKGYKVHVVEDINMEYRLAISWD
jgi:hypothetical protein